MDTLNLHLINNPAESTTRDDTPIDAVFSRYFEKISSQTYISYYNKISIIEYD